MTDSLRTLTADITSCRRCPRLVRCRESAAATPPRRFAGQTYWARPVPGFGDPKARLLVVGLAPAAHGGNRTGRIFTGDRSGDWLFAALHRAGLAKLPTSVSADDGQEMRHTRVLAAVRCAPPANKPTPEERDTCRPWMERELAELRSTLRVVVVLGGFGWAALWPVLEALGYPVPARRPRFGHGVEIALGEDGLTVLGCFHPSQQNTFTGKLTETMLDDVLSRASELAGLS